MSWRDWFRKRDRDAEVREEMAFHLDERERLNRESGMAPGDAARDSHLRFGNRLAAHEDTRRVQGIWLEQLGRDIRYALRGFRRNPLFAVTAIAALALGIGPAAAVFSVVDRILFRPLPYPNEERLVSLGMKAPIESTEFLLGPAYLDLRDRSTPFEAVTSWSGSTDCDLTEGEALRLTCGRVEASFLDTLGITPFAGRAFTRDEDRPGVPKSVLLSYALWQSRFAGSNGIVGSKISLDGEPAQVIGILPQSFEMPTLNRVDLLIPQALNEVAQRNQGTAVLRCFGRLKPGITVEQAVAGLSPWFRDAMNGVPPQFRKEVSLRVQPLRQRQVGDSALAARLLLGALLLILLLACANTANLLIARATAREREHTIRVALGAGKWAMFRHSFMECLLLAAGASAVGLALAALLIRVFSALSARGIPRLGQASVDGRIVAITFFAAFVAALLFALLPSGSAKIASARYTRRTRGLLRIGLVSTQIALSIVLLNGAVLLLRTFWNVRNSPLGFSAERVLTAQIVLGQQRYSQPLARVAFFESLEQRLARMPGIESWAVSDSLPPAGMMRSMIYSLIDVEGRTPVPQGTGGMVGWRAVTPDYFRALGLAIERGRAFNDTDRLPGQDSVILSRMLERRLFPGEEALGKRLRFGRAGQWYTVVGIAADARNAGLTTPTDPEYYMTRKRTSAAAGSNLGLPDMQRRGFVILRSQLAPEQTLRWLQSEVRSLDPALPVEVESMQQRVGQLASQPRFLAWLVTLFAATGLLLASLGLYGVMSFLVSGRSQEIGIRMAMGATPGRVAGMILAQAGLWTLAGVAAGLAASIIAVRFFRSLLYQVAGNDVPALLTALGILVVIAMLAAYLPSRRAALVDPVEALRCD